MPISARFGLLVNKAQITAKPVSCHLNRKNITMRPILHTLALIAVLAPTQSLAEREVIPLTFSGRLLIDGDASRYGTVSVDCVVRVPFPGGGGSVTGFSSGALFREGVAQVPVDKDGYVNYEVTGDVIWDIGILSDEDIVWTCTAQNDGPGQANAVVHPGTYDIKPPSLEGTIGGHMGLIRSGTGEAVILNAIPPGN